MEEGGGSQYVIGGEVTQVWNLKKDRLMKKISGANVCWLFAIAVLQETVILFLDAWFVSAGIGEHDWRNLMYNWFVT